ncbi:MAG: DUF885 family protein, partial [Pseudomonadota bacterium]
MADALLTAIATDELNRSPQTASRLGLPETVIGYAHEREIDDRSQAIFERTRLKRLEYLEALDRIDATALPAPLSDHVNVMRRSVRTAVSLSQLGHGYVSLGYARPYAADHLSGAWTDVPDLLINRHPILDEGDIETYLARLASLPDALQDEARRLRADATAGVLPPRFSLDRMTIKTSALALTPEDGSDHVFVQHLESAMAKIDGLPEDNRAEWRNAATDLVALEIQPA